MPPVGWGGPRHGRRQRSPPAVSHQPALLQAEKVVDADDEVVEYVNAEDFTGLYQASRQVDVVLARRYVAGWVIVGENDTGGGAVPRRVRTPPVGGR